MTARSDRLGAGASWRWPLCTLHRSRGVRESDTQAHPQSYGAADGASRRQHAVDGETGRQQR